MPIKIKHRFLLTLCLFLISGCSFSQTDTNSAQPTEEFIIEGLCDNALYPVKQNATWTYANTGNPNGNFNYTETITQVTPNGFTVTSQLNQLTRTQAWSCETGGLKAMQLGASIFISTNNFTSQFTTLEVTGVSLPKEIISGIQWLYSLKLEGTTTMPNNEQAPASGVYTHTMQEMGIENITVPAGTFDATKFQANITLEIVADVQGVQTPISITNTNLIWYAPTIGYIKSIDTVNINGQIFTSTTELQSYNIP